MNLILMIIIQISSVYSYQSLVFSYKGEVVDRTGIVMNKEVCSVAVKRNNENKPKYIINITKSSKEESDIVFSSSNNCKLIIGKSAMVDVCEEIIEMNNLKILHIDILINNEDEFYYLFIDLLEGEYPLYKNEILEIIKSLKIVDA